MGKTKVRRTPKCGLPPGTPVHIGEERVDHVTFQVYRYNEHNFEERTLNSASECLALRDDQRTTWINVQGLQHVETLQALADGFAWHPLVLEDVVNTASRARFEDYGDSLFILLKRLSCNAVSKEIGVEQVSIIQGPNYVVSFQEGGDEAFSAVIDRLRNDRGQTRRMGADYLAYELVDALVDHCFVVLEDLDQAIEALEEKMILEPRAANVQEFHKLKRELMLVRTSVRPIREGLSHLQHGKSSLVTDSTTMYFRDVYDHLYTIMESTDNLREVLSGMFDVYLSNLSHQMNETMKVLTVIATIFIPLTFLTGIFGMNFRHMPALNWWWGMPVLMGLMLVIAGGMFVQFRRRMWI